MTREVAKPPFTDLFAWASHAPSPAEDLLTNLHIVGSGKGAIALILKYLTQTGVLSNKLDEVLMPDWLGSWVYNQVQAFAFPAKRFLERTKAIFVYHQYGFPQDMDKIMDFAEDKQLAVIEDCAHALKSRYKGKELGSFGDFSLYSFSKWFACFALGGVKSTDKDFDQFVQDSLNQVPFGLTFTKDTIKFIHDRSTFSNSQWFKKYADPLLDMSYAIYGQALKSGCSARQLLNSRLDQEIQVRQQRYQYFLKQTESLGICDHLDKQDITPYVIPIHCSENKRDKLLTALADKHIQTGLYHFDFNRNLLKPDFRPCIWIPCQAAMSDKLFSDLTQLVIKTLKL
jgi:dTDP-4-amino-4,6-dideoxygalactose transaminase